jgi:hypothetical protein
MVFIPAPNYISSSDVLEGIIVIVKSGPIFLDTPTIVEESADSFPCSSIALNL